jgi:hypothetical protein
MSLSGSKLTDEVRALTGREDDTVLIDATRVTRWLNEGQREIAERVPGLFALSFKNTDSIDTTELVQYSIAEISVGDTTVDVITDTTGNVVNRIWDVKYLDGNETIDLVFQHIDEFDKRFPDPTHSDFPQDLPYYWTRRGDYIEILPMCATANCDKDLRFDGDYYPTDLTTASTCVSQLRLADEGLIKFAVSKVWESVGNEQKSAIWMQKFHTWVDEYKAQNDNLYEWEGGMYDDMEMG